MYRRERGDTPPRDPEVGQVHFLFIFGALALACVAFLVFNTGELSARRIRLQNGADAAAHAAATWTARGLNAISANNVAMTQLISMIVLIDSLDVYCDVAPGIARAQKVGCERMKWANWPPLVFDGYRWSLRAAREEAALEILGEIVDQMVATFHPADVDDPDGLWQMLYMLEEFSDAVVEVTPVMAADRAVTMARAHGAEAGFAWPYWTPLPVEKAPWQSLKFPTERGTRCPHDDPYPQFGYKMIYGDIYQHDEEPETGWVAWNIGPYRHLRSAVYDLLATLGGHGFGYSSGGDNAAVNFINFNTITNLKFNLLFNPAQARAVYTYEEHFSDWPPPPMATNSVWIDEDMHSLDPRPNLVIEPKDYPDYVYGPPAPAIQTRWHLVDGASQRWSPRVVKPRDWWPDDPTWVNVPGTNLAWENYAAFEETWDPEFNIGQAAPGVRIPADPPVTVYHQWRYIYRHSFRHRSMDFHNPVFGRDDLPRPYVLNSSWDGMTDAQMADEWSWLGVAWRSGRSDVWPRWFVNTVPGGQMLAVARARLYNPTSWDTFSQNWRVMLVPVGPMTAWLGDTAGMPDTGLLGGLLADQDVEPVRRFFRAVPPDLQAALMTH